MHIPVLLQEVIQFLNPQSNQDFIDCTLGAGGHSKAILEHTAPLGKLLAFDMDSEAIKRFQDYVDTCGLGKRVILVKENFSRLRTVADEHHIASVDGVLLDLGFSSDELEQGGRGFSFLKDEPLDMRYGSREEHQNTAADILNYWKYDDIVKIFREYGEERDAGKITRLVVAERRNAKIQTTQELVNIVLRAKFGSTVLYSHHRIHPATKVFQALRIAVNEELDTLAKVLPQAFEILKPGGMVVVLSFHSLEDRIVKNFFREQKDKGNAKIITKKPIQATEEEVNNNPRSRSAKLRVAEKM